MSTGPVSAEKRALTLARRFRACIPQASVTVCGGLPEIYLSWVLLADMARVMTLDEWVSYCNDEDAVRIR